MINYAAGKERHRGATLLARRGAAAAHGSAILIGMIYIAVKTVDTPRLSRLSAVELPCLSAQLDADPTLTGPVVRGPCRRATMMITAQSRTLGIFVTPPSSR